MRISKRDKDHDLVATIGRTIKLLRIENDWSQDELAATIGVSIPAISKIETGLTDLTISRLKQFAVVFEVPLAYFLQEAPPENTEDLLLEIQKRDKQIISLQNKVIKLLK